MRHCPPVENDRSLQEDAMSPRPPLPPFTEETAKQKVHHVVCTRDAMVGVAEVAAP